MEVAWSLKTVHLSVGCPGLCTGLLREVDQVPERLVALRVDTEERFWSLADFTSEETNSERGRVCYLRSPGLATVSVPLGFECAC